MGKTLLLAIAVALTACGTSRGAQQPRTGDTRREPVATSQPYEMKGTVRSVGGGILGLARSITIARKDAPTTQLHVADETRITLDDRPARLSDIREGDEVRAIFDFDESRPVAIEITAKKPRR